MATNSDKECYECEACHVLCISFESITRHLVSDHDTNERIGYLKRSFLALASPSVVKYVPLNDRGWKKLNR